MPSVVVWMVTYNHGTYIRQSIESVMMQITSFDFKLFIGEDYSSDDTRKICLELRDKHPQKIVLFLNELNIGAKANGIAMYRKCCDSGANYIAQIEGDDYWIDDRKLQKQVDYLEQNKNVAACFHNLIKIDSRGNEFGKLYGDDHKTEIFFDDLIKGAYMQTCSLVFRADTQKLLPFIDGHLPAEDDSLGYCLLRSGDKAKFMNECMAVYRVHEGGVWSMLSREKRDKIALTNFFQYCAFYIDDKKVYQAFKKKTTMHLYSMMRYNIKHFQLIGFLENLNLYIKLALQSRLSQSSFSDYFL